MSMSDEVRFSTLKRHPVATYFGLTFAASWTGALLVAAAHLLKGEALPKLTGILMFPAMLLGPSVAGIVLTRLLDGPAGMRDLLSRMGRIRVPLRWYGVLLIPSCVILVILLSLNALVSPAYAPNRFLVGLAFGIPAGFLEEIGWMGFAYPRMLQKLRGLTAAVLLGLLWGIWHMPVIDFLGTVTPHGKWWFPFFAAFTAAMTAVRILIAWLYCNTGSVLLCQFTHVCSTGALVIFSPVHVSAGQEVLWYAVYAVALWLLIFVLSQAVSGFPCREKLPRVG
jgi:membrane protease YdiL (CAAX protease family)